MSRHEPATVDDFLRLHARRLADDGTPAMAERFVNHLDADDRERDMPPEVITQTVREAYTRLTAEHTALATVARLCYRDGQSVRAAAPLLGVGKSTVGCMRMEAVALIARWTNVHPERVDYELSHLEQVRGTA